MGHPPRPRAHRGWGVTPEAGFYPQMGWGIPLAPEIPASTRVDPSANAEHFSPTSVTCTTTHISPQTGLYDTHMWVVATILGDRKTLAAALRTRILYVYTGVTGYPPNYVIFGNDFGTSPISGGFTAYTQISLGLDSASHGYQNVTDDMVTVLGVNFMSEPYYRWASTAQKDLGNRNFTWDADPASLVTTNPYYGRWYVGRSLTGYIDWDDPGFHTAHDNENTPITSWTPADTPATTPYGPLNANLW